MKLISFCLGLTFVVSWATWVHAVPPRDNKGPRPQQPMSRPTRPTPNHGTPSLSGGGMNRPSSQPTARPGFNSGGNPLGNQFSGKDRPGVGNSPSRKPSLLPATTNRPSTQPGFNRPGGNDRPDNRPGFDRPGNNRPGYDRPGYNRPIDHRPDVVVNRPDINFNRPTINRPTINNNNLNINRPVVVNRPITNVNNTTVNNTVINNNTNVINKNYGTQNTFGRPGYNRYNNYSGNYYRGPRNYYPQLHNHWQPTVWSGGYQPAYYNYSFSSGGLSLSTTNYAFSNPYYVRPATTSTVIYDYSQPISVPAPNYQETDDELVRSERAIRRFDDAREVFRRGEYGRANELIDEAIEQLPSDPNLHEFRSLVLFARKRYPEAAAALYSVLAVSPGWDAGTIAKLYDDPQTYLKQAADLEEFCKANRESMDAWFLLVYHDLVRGNQTQAERLLTAIAAKQPDDRVVQTLLTALRGKIEQEKQAEPPLALP